MEIVQNDSGLSILDGVPHDAFYMAPIPIQLDGLFYQVNRAGITCQTPPNFLIRRSQTYPFNVVHCVLSGRGSVTVRKVTHSLQKGQVFILPAHEAHIYTSDPIAPMGLVWVEFGGGDSTRLSKYILDEQGPVLSGDVFHNAMDLCTSILYRPSCTGAKISRVLYDMLITLCTDSTKSHDRQNLKYRQILDFINDHLGDPLTLGIVAEKFGYHPAYLCGLFPKIAGVSFSKYLIHRRLSRACYLLMTTDQPLERIAQDLGFYDTSHFILRFKEAEGITPARYRSQNYGAEAAAGALEKHKIDTV